MTQRRTPDTGIPLETDIGRDFGSIHIGGCLSDIQAQLRSFHEAVEGLTTPKKIDDPAVLIERLEELRVAVDGIKDDSVRSSLLKEIDLAKKDVEENREEIEAFIQRVGREEREMLLYLDEEALLLGDDEGKK